VRNVVLLRCGKSSLHPSWFAAGWEKRKFELVLSYFDAAAYASHEPREGVRAVLFPGGKWDGIAKTIKIFPDIAQADRIWLPDDDLHTEVEVINSLFDLSYIHRLSICQPSLTRDSYFSHIHLIQCDGFSLRFSNCVEIMAPCLDRATLHACLPLFQDNVSGFGLDWLWTRLTCGDPRGGAIIDRIAVRHTRPIGTSLAKTMDEQQIAEEQMKLLRMVGIYQMPNCLCHAGIDHEGTVVTSQTRIGFAMWRSFQRHRSEFIDQAWAKKQAKKSLRRHLIRRADRSFITLPDLTDTA
jgi:hypothetical protein